MLLKATKTLKKYFGYDAFYPMQQQAIQSVIDKKDTVVLMPTGGGKSMIFQIPGIIQDGVAIVISPLIALMKDQVDGLIGNGIKAAFLNSTQTAIEQGNIITQLTNKEIDLLYVSPERVVTEDFFHLITSIKVNLFAIDEAHCISSWGHDFRPEYTKLKFLKRQFPEIPILALTATADKLTREDIKAQLEMTNPNIFISSFNRANLSLNVLPGRDKFPQIKRYLDKHPNSPGIIYCLSRKNTENVAAKLQDAGFSAQPYHAGLSKEKRSTTQEDFLNDDIQIIVATIAFGMGIDKSNIRFVMHYNLPKNIEGYYQEIGRAGRDGMPADTMLFYSFGDVMILKQIIANNGQREVQEGKLQRMQEYSDALICRRKILLAYFNEDLKEDCGNCDICKNPPQTFDGTTLTQKALSALLRMKEQVGANMLIDVLRGSSRRDIFEKGYNNIKTYGAGNDTSNYAWQIYLLQIMQQGFIEIAINDNNTLKVTPAGKEILFENRQVKLVKQKEIFEQREANKTKAKTKSRSKATIIKDELFEKLRTKRKEIADQKNVPPYVVFSDATLSQMVENKPIVEQDFLEISGVGDKKLEVYGEIFMQVIRNYLTEKKSSGTNIKGSTYLITWDMLKKEKSIEEIATERKLNTGTVYSHIAYLYTRGFNVNIENYISQSDLNEISAAVKELNYPKELAPIFKHLNEKQDYFKIRLTLAWMEKKN